MWILLIDNRLCVERYNRRTQNVALCNKIRRGDIDNNVTKYADIIHATIVLVRYTRSCSEEIVILRNHAHRCYFDEVITLACVVCLIVICNVYSDTTIDDSVKRVICSEDDTMTDSRGAHLIEECDLLTLSCLEVLALSTMNNSRDKVRATDTREGQELIAQLR